MQEWSCALQPVDSLPVAAALLCRRCLGRTRLLDHEKTAGRRHPREVGRTGVVRGLVRPPRFAFVSQPAPSHQGVQSLSHTCSGEHQGAPAVAPSRRQERPSIRVSLWYPAPAAPLPFYAGSPSETVRVSAACPPPRPSALDLAITRRSEQGRHSYHLLKTRWLQSHTRRSPIAASKLVWRLPDCATKPSSSAPMWKRTACVGAGAPWGPPTRPREAAHPPGAAPARPPDLAAPPSGPDPSGWPVGTSSPAAAPAPRHPPSLPQRQLSGAECRSSCFLNSCDSKMPGCIIKLQADSLEPPHPSGPPLCQNAPNISGQGCNYALLAMPHE